MWTAQTRNIVVMANDVFWSVVALLSAYFLRYNLSPPSWHLPTVLVYTVVFAGICVAAFFVSGLYRGMWRFASIADLKNIVIASTLAMLGFVMVMFVVDRLSVIPRSVPLIAWFEMIVLLSAPRVAYRVYRARQGRLPQRSRLLLIGSTEEAEGVIRRFGLESGDTDEIVGIVTFDPGNGGTNVRGTSVLGSVDRLDDVIARLTRNGRRPNTLVVAEPREHPEAVRRITEAGVTHQISVRRVSAAKSLDGDGGPNLDQLTLEDLLGRKPAQLELERISELVRGATVLITGAGGSIGAELTRQVARQQPARLILLDSSEFALYEIDREIARDFPNLALRSVIASVRDRAGMFALMGEAAPGIVFHAAALKHVPLIEENVCAGVRTNVGGTRNVADAAAANGIKAMVMISTDKAIRPSSVMGATKRAAEAYCQALDTSGTQTRFITVRFGNVLGSNGSVVPLFESQIRTGGPVTVTHPDMKRYFMSIREATELVLQAAAFGLLEQDRRGGILVLDMGEPVKIVDLARTMIAMSGRLPDIDIPIVFSGLRPGEKLFEELFDPDEANEPAPAEGVFMAKPRLIDLAELTPLVDRLEDAAAERDIPAALEALRRIVPEFERRLRDGDCGVAEERRRASA